MPPYTPHTDLEFRKTQKFQSKYELKYSKGGYYTWHEQLTPLPLEFYWKIKNHTKTIFMMCDHSIAEHLLCMKLPFYSENTSTHHINLYGTFKLLANSTYVLLQLTRLNLIGT